MAADPAALKIRTYPDAMLRTKALAVTAVTGEVRAVAARMIELMYQAEGVGLAAPQVGLPWRLFVTHVPEGDDRSATADPPSATLSPRVYINPVLSALRGEVEILEEGCLSLPDIRGDVQRPPLVTITALDEHGQDFTHAAAGLLARCFQHEVDHLDGVLIIDKMTPMSRLKNRAAVRGLEKSGGR